MPLVLPSYTTNVQLYAHIPAIEVPTILNSMATDFKLYMNSSMTAIESHVTNIIEPDLTTFKDSILADISQFAISNTSYSTSDINDILAGADGSTYTLDAQNRIATATDGVSHTSNITYDVQDRITAYRVTISKNGTDTIKDYTVAYSASDIPTISLVI
jgi:hypothetical protein